MKSIDDTLSGTNKMIPPTSGGFLGYSPNKRTIKSNTKMRSSGGGNTPLMLFEPAKKPLSNEEILRKQLHDAYTAGHVSFNPVPQANRKVQDAQMHFTSAPDATAPILLNSFPTTTEGPLGITKKPVSDVETQVDMSVYKKHFHGLSEYTNWMMRDVDPFLNGLREAILDNKPIDIPKYVTSYCASYGVSDAPLTLEGDPPILEAVTIKPRSSMVDDNTFRK